MFIYPCLKKVKMMIEMIKYELIKLWSKKSFKLFLMTVFILNISMFAYVENIKLSQSPYQKFQSELLKMNNEDRYEFVEEYYQKIDAFMLIEQMDNYKQNEEDNEMNINSIQTAYDSIDEKYFKAYESNATQYYTQNLESEFIFIESIYNELSTVYHYPDYIESIMNKASDLKTISIFNHASSYAKENIQKTAHDFKNVETVSLNYELEEGVVSALSFSMTSLLLVVVALVVVNELIVTEKERGLLAMIKATPKGNQSLIIAKMMTMSLTFFIVSCMLTLSLLIYMQLTFGLGDLTRSIQSLATCIQCPLNINVLQMIILCLFIQWLGCIVVGLTIFCIAILSQHKASIVLTVLGLFVIEVLLFLFISPTGSLYFLKFINILFVLQPFQLFSFYMNINVFGTPVLLQNIILIILFLSIIILWLLNMWKFNKLQTLNLNKESLFYWKFKRPIIKNRFIQELYKIMILQKGMIFIVICLCMQVYQYQQLTIYKSQEESIYMTYMDVLEGPLTNDKEVYIKSEKEKYEKLNHQIEQTQLRIETQEISETNGALIIEQYQNQKYGEEVFDAIYQQYEDIQKDSHKEFVVPFVYQWFYLSENYSFLPMIVLLTFMILTFSNAFNYEKKNNVESLVSITPIGIKQMNKQKKIIFMIISLLYYCLILSVPLIKFIQTYGMPSLLASIRNITVFDHYTFNIPLIVIPILHLATFLIVTLLTFHVIWFLFLKTKSYMSTMLLSLIIIVVPLILSYGGLRIMNVISVYSLVMSPLMVAMDNGMKVLLMGIVYFIITIMLYFYNNLGKLLK